MPEQKSELARWAQVGATMFLGVVGLIFTVVQNNQQEQNRTAQVGLQLLSQRELSEMDFRQNMFEVLVEELLDSNVDVRERVTRLQLFQDNFHDVFNGRALFDVLEKEAEKRPKEERESLIHDLVSLAKEVTVAQELLVGAAPNPILLLEGDSITVFLPKEDEEPDEARHEIRIKLIKVRHHDVELAVTIDPEKPQPRKLQFKVSYFDAPLTDNTLLPDKHRFAITLKDTKMEGHPHNATLNMLEFPADYVTTGYRPTIKESNKMIQGN